MFVLWPVSEGQPSCRDREFDPMDENVALDFKFKCMCDRDRGFLFENGECIPKSECGCLLDNGDYVPVRLSHEPLCAFAV